MDVNFLVLRSVSTPVVPGGEYHSGLFIQGDTFGMAPQPATADDINFGISFGASTSAVMIFNNKSPLNGGQALDLNLISGNTGVGAINIWGDLNIAPQSDNRVAWIDGNIMMKVGSTWKNCGALSDGAFACNGAT